MGQRDVPFRRTLSCGSDLRDKRVKGSFGYNHGP
jgi:hypothetical protein